jgi:mono/diheme cytochrome c family protein
MTRPKRPTCGRRVGLGLGLALAAGALAGCQQRMAVQPAPRPYERQENLFPFGQTARPLERGVVHRNQLIDGDPLVTWLTAEGKAPKATPEWQKSVDPEGKTAPPPGAPTDVKNFVAELPFEMTEVDLRRGQTLYQANCALCHGAAGSGNGKIPERGFLRPPSYHTDPADKEMDWSTMGESGTPRYGDLPAGFSRGFGRYGVRVPLKEVPIGYVFQVISGGFGGMAAHDTQLPNPADRWRVAAYVRTLQLSQAVPEGDLPAAGKAELTKAGGKK